MPGAGNPDKEDAVEERAFLRIPVGTPAGVYTVILDAWNSDSEASLERRVLVVGAEEVSKVEKYILLSCSITSSKFESTDSNSLIRYIKSSNFCSSIQISFESSESSI